MSAKPTNVFPGGGVVRLIVAGPRFRVGISLLSRLVSYKGYADACLVTLQERWRTRARKKGESMPSPYKPESRGDPYDTSMENLRKASARRKELGAYPRPWRSKQEELMVRRLVCWWWTCRDASRPSARAWAKQLRVSHVWVLKLVRKFETDPAEVHRLQRMGDPMSAELDRAKEYTGWMRARGEFAESRAPARSPGN